MASRRVGVGRALVAAQVGLSLLLLTGAGLYLRTLINLARVDVGFDTENLLLFQVHPRGSRSADADPAAFYERMQEALVALPGARGATLLDFPLLHNASSSGGFTLSGRSADTSLDTRRIRVGETFFTTMGIPVVQGRAFDAGDTVAAPKAVVVNEAFARKHLAGEDALGRSLRMWEADWQIVGVCRDAKYSNLRQATPPTAYFLSRQMFYSRFARSHLRQPYFAVRTSLPPLSLAPAVRQAVAAVDADVALSHFTTQEAVRNRGMGRERLFAALCGSLAVVAVLLSCIGLYALLAYHVARHKGDIAVRMAVGAQPAEVARQVVREALLLASVGVAVGLPLLAALGRYVRSQLYGVRPDDPLTLATVVLALVLVAGLSAWIPARRAARVDPMVALRCE